LDTTQYATRTTTDMKIGRHTYTYIHIHIPINQSNSLHSPKNTNSYDSLFILPKHTTLYHPNHTSLHHLSKRNPKLVPSKKKKEKSAYSGLLTRLARSCPGNLTRITIPSCPSSSPSSPSSSCWFCGCCCPCPGSLTLITLPARPACPLSSSSSSCCSRCCSRARARLRLIQGW